MLLEIRLLFRRRGRDVIGVGREVALVEGALLQALLETIPQRRRRGGRRWAEYVVNTDYFTIAFGCSGCISGAKHIIYADYFWH